MERYLGYRPRSFRRLAAVVRPYILLAVAGMCAVTLFEKGAPLWLLGGRKINPAVERWLGFIPAAVLAALLFPEILLHKEAGGTPTLFLSWKNYFLIACLPSIIVAYRKKSFFGTIVVGMAAVAILRLLQ